MNKQFEIHQRLTSGGFYLGSILNCALLLKNNAHYKWFILIPKVDDSIIDIDQLSQLQIDDLNQATYSLSSFIKTTFNPDKLNIGNIGNVVQQMHVHVVGRFHDDPAWPKVVWEHPKKISYPTSEVTKIKHQAQSFFSFE